MRVYDQRAQVIVLTERIRGLEGKIDNAGVFDDRDNYYLCDMTPISLEEGELAFLDLKYGEKEKIPFVDKPRSYIVSAYVPEGYYHYSCCGVSESDAQYIAIRTNKEGVDATIDKLYPIGKNIRYGREIDIKGLNKLLNKKQEQNIEARIKDFMKLNPKEQKTKLRKIFEGIEQ